MRECHPRDAEDAVIRFSNKDVGVGVVVGEAAPPNEPVGPGDIRRITAVHVILHLRASAAARSRVERPTVDVGGGGTPELVVHLIVAGGAVHVRDVGALVVVPRVGVPATRAILAINVVIAEFARKAVAVPESVRIGVTCVMAICDGYPAHGYIVRRFIAFDTRCEIVAVLTS